MFGAAANAAIHAQQRASKSVKLDYKAQNAWALTWLIELISPAGPI
jgi:hypothetical protein